MRLALLPEVVSGCFMVICYRLHFGSGRIVLGQRSERKGQTDLMLYELGWIF